MLAGKIRPGYPLVRAKDLKRIGEIMQIQDKGKPIPEATKGMSVAISIRGNVIIGRHVKEGDILYTDVPREHVIKFIQKYSDILSDEEKEIFREIREIRRRILKRG